MSNHSQPLAVLYYIALTCEQMGHWRLECRNLRIHREQTEEDKGGVHTYVHVNKVSQQTHSYESIVAPSLYCQSVLYRWDIAIGSLSPET